MASNTLELKVLISAIDKITAPLKAMQREGTGAAKRIKEMHKELAGLKRTSGQVGEFARLKQAVQDSSKALEAAQKKTNEAARAMQGMGPPTKEASKAFAQAQKEAAKLKEKHGALTTSLQKQRDALAAAGISTRTLSADKAALSAKTNTLTASIDKESAALAKANERARQLHATRAKYSAMQSKVDAVRQGSQTAAIAGAAMLAPVAISANAYKQHQTAMLGVAKQVEGARDASGQLTQVYRDMESDIRALARTTPMATTKIAALTEGFARMGIQGRANLMAATSTAAAAATAFDMPADQLAEDMGKIAGLYKIPIKNIRELGDTINWLDDNAMSKGGEIIDVLQRMGGYADKMGYKNAAALGSTFLSLGEAPELAASASGAMIRELSIATMQKKRFKDGIAAIGMDAKQLEAGMAKDANGTIMQVMQAINKLKPEDQTRAATQIFGKEYGKNALKLAQNLPEWQRQMALVNDPNAAGSMDREASARTGSLAGAEQIGKNKLFETLAKLGQTLEPSIVKIAAAIGGMLDRLNSWMTANPKAAETIVLLVSVVGSLLLILGTAGIAITAIIAPMLAFGAATGIALWPILAIVAAVALLVAAGVMLYLRWNDIAAWWSGLWAKVQNYVTQAVAKIQSIIQSFNPLQLFYSAFAGVLRWFGIDLPAKFTDFGKNIIQGLINGIKAAWEGAKKAVRFVADAVKSAFTTANAIHSPSRVFHQYGAFLMQGLEQGITRTTGLPVRSMRAAAQQIIRTPMSAIKADTRAPIGGGMFGGAGALAGAGGITIHVHAAPGMSEHTLASLVARKIEEATRATARARRTSFMDMD